MGVEEFIVVQYVKLYYIIKIKPLAKLLKIKYISYSIHIQAYRTDNLWQFV
jgi:hypothetical protein